jgi:hypothetical protein
VGRPEPPDVQVDSPAVQVDLQGQAIAPEWQQSDVQFHEWQPSAQALLHKLGDALVP